VGCHPPPGEEIPRLKNLNSSVPEITVRWSPGEVRGMASSVYRDLADERRAAGDVAAARELDRLAEQPEATLEAARQAWAAQFGESHELERREAELELEMGR
jgi:hypothetical protein